MKIIVWLKSPMPLATVNVVNTASYTDVDRDFYSGSAFYAVQ
jgi:hypothetical protein